MKQITEEMIDKALEYLRETAGDAAKARAERLYLEEFKKSKKALLMTKYPELPVNAQERESLADDEYLNLLDAWRDAVEQDEFFRYKREAAGAIIEAWRTQQANLRAEGKAYT